MTRRTPPLSDALYDYLLSVSLREPLVLRRLREETAGHPQSDMQISPEQGQLMALLARTIGARRTLELGVFTGYSALAVALALPDDGRVVACDLSEEYTAVARRYWREAGVEHKIDLRLGPAAATLEALLGERQEGAFDFAFLDADKENNDLYYEQLLRLLRPGGLLLIDNAFWGGLVIDPAAQDPATAAIRTLNEKVHHDDRVDLALLPVADGLTLVRKR
jgi:caffeoyl-CoA O-methyltransferase